MSGYDGGLRLSIQEAFSRGESGVLGGRGGGFRRGICETEFKAGKFRKYDGY
jgi:hypothetical protein